MLDSSRLLTGSLVRLSAEEPDIMAAAFWSWRRNSEYMRLLDSDPLRLFSVKKIKEWLEKEMEDENNFNFGIRTLEDDRLVGFTGIYEPAWNHGDTFVGIGIGASDDWGKGYGTDAMRLLLRYAFTELNLRRVTLNVFEYNPRGIRSYEKAGFKVEGKLREALNRDGRRWDIIYMGILREEWVAMNQHPS